ncbi:hypothetical protein F5Y05DRAFT_413573 [Hypoxylon sp. FL0543]|nr:hypothetical protein F5Y05DRAFT_413573 [Hypoxylon sp. FL0543]
MDPLSITASVITLIDAAKKAYCLLQSIRHADTELAALCKELRTFTDYLQSIAGALGDKSKSPLALAAIHKELREQTEIALEDCKKTLDGLTELVGRMSALARSKSVFRRPRVAVEMQLHARDVASFRNKIQMSILSLQTLLQVITVSLSLRSNASQELLMKRLKHLARSLRKSNDAAIDPRSTLFLDGPDIRLAQHLKGLVRAAQDFHASASTTASTIYSGEDRQGSSSSNTGSDEADSSVPSRFSSFKQRRIETFLRNGQPYMPVPLSCANTLSPNYPEVVVEESHIRVDSVVSDGMSKIAQKAIAQLDFKKAEEVLCETLKWYKVSGLDDIHHRRLRTKLALANLLQGKGREAEDLILDLAEFHSQGDATMRQLLYALAVSYLHEMKFKEARETCQRLWETGQMPNAGSLPSKNDLLTLLAITYRLSGEPLIAEAIEEEYPDISTLQRVPKIVDSVARCGELLTEFFDLEADPTPQALREHQSLVLRMTQLPLLTEFSSLQLHELGSPMGERRSWSSGDEQDEIPKNADARDVMKKRNAINRSLKKLAGHMKRSRSYPGSQVSRAENSDISTPRSQRPFYSQWNPFARSRSNQQRSKDTKASHEKILTGLGQDSQGKANGPSTPPSRASDDDVTDAFSFVSDDMERQGILLPRNDSTEPRTDLLSELHDTALVELEDTSPRPNSDGMSATHINSLDRLFQAQPSLSTDDCSISDIFRSHQTQHSVTPEYNAISYESERAHSLGYTTTNWRENELTEPHNLPQVAHGLTSQHQVSRMDSERSFSETESPRSYNSDSGYGSETTVETSTFSRSLTPSKPIEHKRLSKSADADDANTEGLSRGKTAPRSGVSPDIQVDIARVGLSRRPSLQPNSKDHIFLPGVGFLYSALQEPSRPP